MLDGLTITQILSLFFGLYFLSAGLGMLFDEDAVPVMFETMQKDPAVGFLTGIIAFVTGAVVVSIHDEWSGTLAIIISVFGWFALAEGILMLAFRKWFLDAFSFMTRSRGVISVLALLAIVMGAAFIWMGIRGL